MTDSGTSQSGLLGLNNQQLGFLVARIGLGVNLVFPWARANAKLEWVCAIDGNKVRRIPASYVHGYANGLRDSIRRTRGRAYAFAWHRDAVRTIRCGDPDVYTYYWLLLCSRMGTDQLANVFGRTGRISCR